MTEQHQLNRIEGKVDRITRVLLDLVRYLLTEKDQDMSKIHDDLLATARQLDATADTLGTAADAVITAKTEGDSSMADVAAALDSATGKLSALQTRLAAAATDAAAQGGSTGGGSGSGASGTTDLNTGA